ncbi:MAG: conjugal transfer protein TraF [Brevinematales bacterium]|nr:conjugal transfer protein TraF [Brevinematales bacterium]
MSRFSFGVMLIVLCILLLGIYAEAAFEYLDRGTSVRAKGFGNAMFGLFDGVNGMEYNPALMANTKNIESRVNFGIPIGYLDDTGMNMFSIFGVIPFSNKGYAGIDYLAGVIAGGNVPYFFREGSIGFSYSRFNVLDLYYEQVISIGYAKNLDDFISKGARISAGVKLNLYNLGLVPNSDTQVNPYLGDRLSTWGFGMDVGVTYDFSYTIRLGFAVQNIIKPNTALIEGNESTLPRKIKFGANWIVGSFFDVFEDLMVGVGITQTEREPGDNRELDLTYHFGVETWFLNRIIGLRAGYEFGLYEFSSISVGLSFGYVFADEHEVNFDYSLSIMPHLFASVGDLSHSFSLVYRFRLPRSAFAYTEEKIRELQFMEELEKRKKEMKELGIDTKSQNTGKKEEIQQEQPQQLQEQPKQEQPKQEQPRKDQQRGDTKKQKSN